jgi:hypothetical protein
LKNGIAIKFDLLPRIASLPIRRFSTVRNRELFFVVDELSVSAL